VGFLARSLEPLSRIGPPERCQFPVVDGRRTRGNELVVWIDDEKRRDLFAELQMCRDPGSYANSAGVASDPENRSTQESVRFLVPTLSLGVGKRLD
jgi:hypothetical protein